MRTLGDEILDFAGALLGHPRCPKCERPWHEHTREKGCPAPTERKAE